MEHSRGVVGEGIEFARDVVVTGNVSVEALVDAEEAEQVGRHASGCGGASACPEECGEVVGPGEDGAFSHVKILGCSLELEEGSG